MRAVYCFNARCVEFDEATADIREDVRAMSAPEAWAAAVTRITVNFPGFKLRTMTLTNIHPIN